MAAKKMTGRSADAAAGAAAARKKAAAAKIAKAKAAESKAGAKRNTASDAVSRRYKSTESFWSGKGGKTVLDKVTGVSRALYTDNSDAKNPVYYYVNDPKTEKKMLGKTVNGGKSRPKAQKKLKNVYGK
jgi:hypothetical protein